MAAFEIQVNRPSEPGPDESFYAESADAAARVLREEFGVRVAADQVHADMWIDLPRGSYIVIVPDYFE